MLEQVVESRHVSVAGIDSEIGPGLLLLFDKHYAIETGNQISYTSILQHLAFNLLVHHVYRAIF